MCVLPVLGVIYLCLHGSMCMSVSHSDIISLTPAPMTLICDWLSWQRRRRQRQRKRDLHNYQLQRAA